MKEEEDTIFDKANDDLFENDLSTNFISRNTSDHSISGKSRFKSTSDMVDVATGQIINIEVKHFEMIIVANPRSGSRKGQVLLNKYQNKPGFYEFENGKNCNVEVMDVITQSNVIVSNLKDKIRSKTILINTIRQEMR